MDMRNNGSSGRGTTGGNKIKNKKDKRKRQRGSKYDRKNEEGRSKEFERGQMGNWRRFSIKEKFYVLKDKELRVETIWLYHDILVVGYRGRWKMTELVTRNYWWLEVTKYIGKYMERYDICQRMKNSTEAPAGKLMINKILEKL